MATEDWETSLNLQKTFGAIEVKVPGDYYTNEFIDGK